MPVQTKVPIEHVSQTDFHLTNEKVMGLAFRVHSELGRFCHEKIYQNALHAACLANGMPTSTTEIEILVSYKEYSKSYFVDLLVGNGIVYETKTVDAFNENHRKQLLHYLMLLDLFHGTLLNFRSQSLQHEFVSTNLTFEKRRRLTIKDSEWENLGASSQQLKGVMLALLGDWGAFLDTTLYTDAVTHFLGGPERILTPVEVISGGNVLGTQNVRMLSEGTAFKITATTKNINYYKKDLLRFLSHTNLKSVQWINLNHHNIEFRTLSK
ncbi:GxxExxY protein [Pontiellaceae bacterium B12227]|nr:GxxExxY protein [Pontiellaceae bacterium B12227]